MTYEHLKKTLWDLERKLSNPNLRGDSTELSQIMHDDFIEFGASGRCFDKTEIINLLVNEQNYVEYEVEKFTCTLLSPSVAHVTYIIPQRTDKNGSILYGSTRSSIWKNTNGEWQIYFHQGTRIFK
ncbi:DUF4440 domain-containing protein [Kordiimonas sp. SCSIO 12610]|uniref:nuclear transport factor 2 family protein n=1 Tax=Kordiimonas sp. SCSIO 12610 TaxID=2829597 RepID=UPI0021F97D6D|nr:nuclear transport factor 2 family protein [Kordiimonas sp. SCSIO 12610]